MLAELTDQDRYTIISVDGHAGAELRDYKPYLASRWHDEFDAWADAYVNPFADLLGADRVPQLGQRAPARGDRVAGRRRRGAVPEHGPAVLRAGQPHRARADRGRLRAAVGRACRRTTAGSPTSARPRRAGAPGCAQVFLNDLDDTLAEIRWAKENMDVFGGILLPNVPPNSDAAAAVGPALRAALGPVRGARRRAATSTRAAGSPTSASTKRRGRSCSSSSRGSRTARCGT